MYNFEDTCMYYETLLNVALNISSKAPEFEEMQQFQGCETYMRHCKEIDQFICIT